MEISTEVGLWTLTALPPMVLAAAWSGGLLRLRRDFLFLLLFAQSCLYLHLGPTLCVSDVSPNEADLYVLLESAALLAFELPFLFLYIFAVREIREERPPSLEVRPASAVVFLAVAAIASLTFLAVVFQQDMLFRRVGGEALAIRHVDMPPLSFVIYRGMLAAGPFFCGLTFLIAALAPAGALRSASRAVTFLFWLVFLGVTLPNSRLETARVLAFTGGLYLLYLDRTLGGRTLATLARVAGVLVLGLYTYRVAANARAEYSPSDPVPIRVFNPFHSPGVPDDYALGWRLNGVDLMAQLTPLADARGYAWGRAWAVPAFLSVGGLVDPDRTRQLKLSLATTAKSYLMNEYTWIRTDDYYSCMLTDAYGNFGMLGFPLVALALAFTTAAVTWGIFRCRSSLGVLASLLFALHAIQFEQEFIVLLTFWLKGVVPLLAFVSLVNPFHARRPGSPRYRSATPPSPR